MRKFFSTGMCLLLINYNCWGETCPSVAELKNLPAKEWQAFDSIDHQPIKAERLKRFQQAAAYFAVADWLKYPSYDSQRRSYPIIRCYYQDKNGSTLETYLRKENTMPQDNAHYWYKVSGLKQCAASLHDCQFSQNG
jgi:hypothetical protein